MDPSAKAKGALAAAVAGAAAAAGAAADLSRGLSSISPAEQMAIVEAAQRAARESDGGMLIARNHSSDEAMVGSWVSSMEAVWGGLAAAEARAEQRNSNTGSSSGIAAEGALGGAAVAAGPVGGSAEGGAEGDGRIADVGAQSSAVQQVQAVSPVEPQQLQPAVASKAS